MKSIKIVILTALPFWHPGSQELIDRLRARGIQVQALDIFHGYKLNHENTIVDLVPFKLTGFLRKAYLKLFRQRITNIHTKEADLLDLHFVEAYYSKHIPQLGKKYMCSMFGSDLYRTSLEQKKMQEKLFLHANTIVLTKEMREYFDAHFQPQPSKYTTLQYGSERLDRILTGVNSKEQIDTAKIAFNIPTDKIVLTCGYSGIPQQQHEKIVEALSKLDASVASKLFLVFPMTYGGSEAYRNEVKTAVANLNLPFRFVENRLTDEELIQLRLLSDITVNIQTTDALASSIKEAFAAEDVVIVGDWLPYNVYDDMGVYYAKSSLQDLGNTLSESIENLDKRKIQCKSNVDIISNFASWHVLLEQWIEQYNNLLNESE